MSGIAVPDQANFDFGGDPIPDNFLDETMTKAVTEHSRKESMLQSVRSDFSKIVDVNVATNIAENLIGNQDLSKLSKSKPRVDPDEDDVRVGIEEHTEATGPQLDDMLINAVTQHQRKESRAEYLKSQLHELFPDNADDDNDTVGGGLALNNLGGIANNLVAFLQDEPDAAAPTAIINSMDSGRHKARGSTDLSGMQEEVQRLKSDKEELNSRVLELENTNYMLMKQIEYLQNSKTKLAVESTKCIDELREMLISYQTNLKLDKQ